jgi:high affinity sulfate transporter 1
MNIPQALGYTRIAGMPVVTGLYTLLLPLAAFAGLGSSRFLVVAADSATAAILAAGLAGLAPTGSPQYIVLATWVALLTAAFLLLGRILRLGFIADFLSRTVLVGFLTGVGFQVGIAVLGETLGLPVTSRRTLPQLLEVLRQLPHVSLPTLAVSACVLVTVLVAQRLAPKFPAAIIAVISATAASAIWSLQSRGVAIVGPVAGGLPHLGLQLIAWHQLRELAPIAASCTVMVITQSAATARIYALRHRQALDENRDLIGLSAANVVSALSGSFVVNGSPTQTAMVESSGGRSQFAQLTTAAVVALVLIFLTRPLQYLPQCVLGSLVLLVAIHLIDIRQLQAIRRESPGEYAIALFTAAVVILAGVEAGILLAMVLSLLRIVQHSYHPHTAVLIPEKNHTWQAVPPAPGIVTAPGFILYRFSAALFYANANRFAEEILSLISQKPSAAQKHSAQPTAGQTKPAQKSPIRAVIVDAEAITNIDYSAARMIVELNQQLAEAGVSLGFARLSADAMKDFDRHQLAPVIQPAMLFDRLHDALDAFDKPSS